MAFFLEIPTFSDSRGCLSVVEKNLPFKIERVFYIYQATKKRGGHRHHKSIQAIISLGGFTEIFVNNGITEKTFILNNPTKCLVLEPQDWHTMQLEHPNTFLLILASHPYDAQDYIHENYPSK